MAKRISISTLNASTIDILNTIRQNASYQYQQNVPEIDVANDIPKVGEVLYGYPLIMPMQNLRKVILSLVKL